MCFTDSRSDTPGSVHQSSLVPPSVPRPTFPHTSLTPVHRATSIIRTPTVARGSSSCRTTPIAIATTSQNGNRRRFNDCPSQRPTPGPTAVESDDDFMTSPSLSTKKTSMNEVMHKCIILMLLVRNIIKQMFMIHCLLVSTTSFFTLDLADFSAFKICWFHISNLVKSYKIKQKSSMLCSATTRHTGT